MDNKEFRIQIGYDQDRYSNDLKTANRKHDIRGQILDIYSEFKLDIDKNTPNKFDFVSDFKTKFKEKYSDQFPEFMKVDQIISISNIPIDKLTELNNEFNSLHSVYVYDNSGVNSLPEGIDYNIYTENVTEFRRYHLATDLISILTELDSIGHRINTTSIVNDLRGLIKVDIRTSEIVPNIPFIKKK